MKPQLYDMNVFDGNIGIDFQYIWNGNQSFGNILQIRENDTDNIVYQEKQITMQLKHTLNGNILKNGTLYNARIATIDIDNKISENSDPILFYCFTTPVFIFDNIQEKQIIKNSSYDIIMSYSQLENEPIQSWEISLYDSNKTKVQWSDINYSNNIKYTLVNLEDNQMYYIKASGITLNGMMFETGYISFTVNYKQPSIYSILTLENMKNDGTIKIQSNIKAIKAKSDKDVIYIDDEYINLRDNFIYIDEDFCIDDNFIINLLGYDLIPNALIMQLSDKKNMINIYLRKGIYDINNREEKLFVELNIPYGNTKYICYSNYIDINTESNKINIYIKKVNGLYDLTIKGGV